MTNIGVGLIGFGLGGRVFHAPFVQAVEGLDLRAVVSRDPMKVHALLPGMAVVPTVEALLGLPDIDLVVVSSPDELHADHAVAALAAGKHVVVDKPFATSVSDARRISEAADRFGKTVTVFHNRRWDADFLTLQRILGKGLLGSIVQFESHFDRWRPEFPRVWKEARRGGSWFDLGPHLVDQAICILGRPGAVSLDLASMREDAPAPDWFHAVLHYPRARAVLHSSKLCADNGLRFAIHGTRGSWVKHGLDTQEPMIAEGTPLGSPSLGVDPLEGIYTPGSDPQRTERIPNERGDYGQFWRALVQALRGEGPSPVPAAEAQVVIEVLEAGLESAARGMTVSLDAA